MYCSFVDKVEEEEAKVIAGFFENKMNYGKAGEFYWKCSEFEHALVCFVKGQKYDEAIQKVHKINSEDLFDFLVMLFAGENLEE